MQKVNNPVDGCADYIDLFSDRIYAIRIFGGLEDISYRNLEFLPHRSIFRTDFVLWDIDRLFLRISVRLALSLHGITVAGICHLRFFVEMIQCVAFSVCRVECRIFRYYHIVYVVFKLLPYFMYPFHICHMLEAPKIHNKDRLCFGIVCSGTFIRNFIFSAPLFPALPASVSHINIWSGTQYYIKNLKIR